MPNSSMNLKCSMSPAQLENRLRYQPSLIELQLFEQDLRTPNRIVETVQDLKDQGIKVYLHHPMRVNGKFLDILSDDPEVHAFYRYSCDVLDDVCHAHAIQCVVHPHYDDPALRDPATLLSASIELMESIEAVVTTTRGHFLWENAPTGVFSSANPYWLSHIARRLELPLCYDISHSFMALHGDNDALRRDIRNAFSLTQYYHVVDSMGSGVHDGLQLGFGAIAWPLIKPYIQARDYVFEIELPNYEDCGPMVESAQYFEELSVLV